MKPHPQQPQFKLSHKAILLGLISAAYPMMGYSMTAARADFVIGNVEIVAADGSRRLLTKGADINAGDAINTANNARAQLKFNDGGYISLQPNTVFRVDEYHYENKTDGSERSFFSLLKGGLRAITGTIGHLNRDNYKVATPSATIGIRGTGYKAEVRDEGLLISVGEGAVMLTNNTGPLLVSTGKAVFVANINARPEPSRNQPNLPPAGFRPFNNQGPNPNLVNQLPNLPKLVSGGGYTLAYAYRNSATGLQSQSPSSSVNAVYNDLGQLTKFSSGSESGGLGTANTSFSATDGIIGWGRWDGYTDPAGSISLQPGVFHYVVGLPTAVMPTTGTATYNLMGYTNPTASDGSTGWTVSGNLNADFGRSSVTVNMSVGNANVTYTITTPNPFMVTSSTFSGTASTSSTLACSSSCSTSISGFFAGANASRAGLSYQINDSGVRTIEGVAAFAGPPPPPL
jgi:hypothetical protein